MWGNEVGKLRVEEAMASCLQVPKMSLGAMELFFEACFDKHWPCKHLLKKSLARDTWCEIIRLRWQFFFAE